MKNLAGENNYPLQRFTVFAPMQSKSNSPMKSQSINPNTNAASAADLIAVQKLGRLPNNFRVRSKPGRFTSVRRECVKRQFSLPKYVIPAKAGGPAVVFVETRLIASLRGLGIAGDASKTLHARTICHVNASKGNSARPYGSFPRRRESPIDSWDDSISPLCLRIMQSYPSFDRRFPPSRE
jgi:hypothetical protein